MPPLITDFALPARVLTNVERFVQHHAPGFVLPRTFGGHLVGADAVADVAFTLGWLGEAGFDEVGGVATDEAIRTVLLQVDGPGTHSFFSYRVAETLARFGAFEGNPLLDRMTPAQVDNLRAACDSTELLELLDAELLPPNYLAVLARCELARQRLGILPGDSRLDELVERTAAMLTANPQGYLDESHDGSGRYDIYTADLYLFCEPMADVLGDAWTNGARNAVDLVGRIVQPSGESFVWGRSTGFLSGVLTLEMAGLALDHQLTDQPDRWRALAFQSMAHLAHLFGDDGVITAHQRRATEDYRGPQRRVQMTFDVLGKLAEWLFRLPRISGAELTDESKWAPRHDLVRLDERAAVWSFQNDQIGFVVPFVGGRSSDYVPSLHRIDCFENPIDSTLACYLPMVHVHGNAITPQGRFVPGEVPDRVDLTDDGVVVEYSRFVASRSIDSPAPLAEIGATRRATYRVDGAAISIHEELSFDEIPDAISILVPGGRHLRVTHAGDPPARVRLVDVDGMTEWRTAWGQIDSLVEMELEPARDLTFTWTVTPKPRIDVTLNHHHYIRTVYDPISDPLTGRVVEQPWQGLEIIGCEAVHVHWPEWCFGFEATVDDHRHIADGLRDLDIKVIWTQHNLTPHLDQPDHYDPIYQVWADACDLAIHHSEWGRDQVLARYRFRDDCAHAVIAHPHFGPAMTENASMPRDEAAEMLGLTSRPAIRIGMIGAPRRQKDIQMVIDAFLAAGRDDVELAIWSMSFLDLNPADPRIVAHVYEDVPRDVYDLRLAACDVIALPFVEHTMLATGTASDLVATGTPGLVSDWPYLDEHLWRLGIAAGQTVASWTDAIRDLSRDQLDEAAAHADELRDRYDPNRIGDLTADAIDSLGIRFA